MRIVTTLSAALMLGVALPAAAQMPPPPPPQAGPAGPGRMFASMSPTGRAIMLDALRGADPRSGHEASKAARDRMLTILDADRLDAVTLKRAMDDEREAANAAKVGQQAAMLTGFQKLSVADRKAFVADARAMRGRMEGRMKNWRERRGDRGGDMPPLPPM